MTDAIKAYADAINEANEAETREAEALGELEAVQNALYDASLAYAAARAYTDATREAVHAADTTHKPLPTRREPEP